MSKTAMQSVLLALAFIGLGLSFASWGFGYDKRPNWLMFYGGGAMTAAALWTHIGLFHRNQAKARIQLPRPFRRE